MATTTAAAAGSCSPPSRSSGSTPTSGSWSPRSTAPSVAWQPGAQLDAGASLRDAVRRIVVRALFGEQLGAEADRFGALLEPGLRYVQRMPQLRFEHDLRVNPYARVQRSNRAADELVLAEVARRRAAGIDADAHPDTLTALLAGVDGESLTDAELLDQVRSLMAAGFDTTVGAAELARARAGPQPRGARRGAGRGRRRPRRPGPHHRRPAGAAAHARRRAGGAAPLAARARRAADVDRPERAPRHGDPRRPAGALQRLRHRSPPRALARPRAVRPRTLAPGAPEPVPYSFVPFGGGNRRCIGFALATLELQVMAVRLVQQVEWRLRRPDVRPTGIATLTPKGGVPIEVTARR